MAELGNFTGGNHFQITLKLMSKKTNQTEN